jgi:ABC-type branched-subunit amino acid transport system substrate-binding protein
MSGGGGAAAGAAGGAAVYAAIANAIKASGSIVSVDAEAFQTILSKMKEPLVVAAPAGFFKSKHQYLTNYKGLNFHTKSDTQLHLPPDAEIVTANKIWIPG